MEGGTRRTPRRLRRLLTSPSFVRQGSAALAVGWLTALALAERAVAANGEDTALNLDSARESAQAVGDGGSPVLRTILGLIVVVALIYAVTWVLKRIKRSHEAKAFGGGLQSLSTLPLGPNRSLHLVRAGEEVVLIGVSEGGVTPIRTYHEAEAQALGLYDALPGTASQPVEPGDSPATAPIGLADLQAVTSAARPVALADLRAPAPAASLVATADIDADRPTASAGRMTAVLDELRRRTVIK